MRNKIKTRLVTIFLVIASILIMAVSLTAVFALAEQLLKTKLGLNYTAPGKETTLTFALSDDETSYTLVSGTVGSDGIIIVPKTYNGLPVTSIKDGAFMNDKDVKEVYIQDSVTTIGNNAFKDSVGLVNLVIGENVEIIGQYAFCNVNIKKIIIPDSVKIIKYCAFGSTQAEELYVGSGVRSIGAYALFGWNLVKIEVSKDNEFYHSENNCLIETATKTLIEGCANSVIPDDGSVRIIGGSAFTGLKITSISIPDLVIRINSGAFGNCISLESVVLGSGLEYISPNAFSECSALTSVEFKNTTGWFVAETSTATSGVDVSALITDTSSAATLLTSTYVRKYWLRSTTE